MASPSVKQTAKTALLAQTLTDTGTETTINLTVTSGDSWDNTAGVARIGSGTSSEWVSFTGVTTNSSTSQTLTGVSRGLKKNATSRTDTSSSLRKGNGFGAQVIFVHHSFQINEYVQKNADETVTGTLHFSNSTSPGLRIPSYTTTERDALTNVDEGDIIYNSTLGITQVFEGGAWASKDTGSSTPNASETVAGKVEIATTAEKQALTATGGTGAILVISNDDTVRTIHPSNGSGSGFFDVNVNGSGDRTAFIDLYSDDTYTDFGLRVIKNSGANGNGAIAQRGTGYFELVSLDSGGSTGFRTTTGGFGRVFQAGEDLTVGAPVYVSQSDGKVYKADNNDTEEKATVEGLACMAVSTDEYTPVQSSGTVYGLSGLTAGTTYYLASTPGTLTSTTPSRTSSTLFPVKIGRAVSTTTLVLDIERLPRRLVASVTQLGNSTTSLTITAGFPISHAIFHSMVRGQVSNCTGVYDVLNSSYSYSSDPGVNLPSQGSDGVILLNDNTGSGFRKGVPSISSNNIVIAWTDSSWDNVTAGSDILLTYEVHEAL